jgi:2-keto-4-pentenoate hydratase
VALRISNIISLSGIGHCRAGPGATTIAFVIDTPLTAADLELHALALRQSRTSRRPIEPLTDTLTDLSVSDAYAIAGLNVQARLAHGAAVSGHKIGLTAPAVQAQLGVDTPDYGTLLDEMEIADGAQVSAGLYIAPRIELEVAFVLGADLRGPGVNAADVRAATAWVRPSLELVDSRVRDWRIRLADTVADAASSAAYVLGAAQVSLAELDVAGLDAELWCGNGLVERGHSSAVLGDPCQSVAWLANALAEQGAGLEAGHVVLSGACTKMVPVRPGDSFRGVIPGLGEVSVSFTAANGEASSC